MLTALHTHTHIHTWSELHALRMKDVAGSDFTTCRALVINEEEMMLYRSMLANRVTHTWLRKPP